MTFNNAPETQNAAWLDSLAIELRLIDVSGVSIGDAVASAREFLADSGERHWGALATGGGCDQLDHGHRRRSCFCALALARPDHSLMPTAGGVDLATPRKRVK